MSASMWPGQILVCCLFSFVLGLTLTFNHTADFASSKLRMIEVTTQLTMPHFRIVDGLPCAARNILQMELYKNTFGLSTI
jgi:hypothetical protein